MKKYNEYYLITDLDGTLLDNKKSILKENLNEICNFVDCGGHFSIATGRSPLSAKRWLKELPINFPCVFYNGSMIKDLQTDCVIDCAYLEKEKFLPFVKRILHQLPTTVVEIFTEQGLMVISDPLRKDPYLEDEKDTYIQSTLQDVQNLEWIKILLCDKHQNLEIAEDYLKEQNLQLVCNSFYSQDFFLEVTPLYHSKGTALKAIRNSLGKTSVKIIAAGDFDNDIEMLQEADFGVAMKNARDCLKSVANYITLDNNHAFIRDIIAQIKYI